MLLKFHVKDQDAWSKYYISVALRALLALSLPLLLTTSYLCAEAAAFEQTLVQVQKLHDQGIGIVEKLKALKNKELEAS